MKRYIVTILLSMTVFSAFCKDFIIAEKGKKNAVFEKNEKAGGMLVYGIPSYKLEKDVVQAEIDIMGEVDCFLTKMYICIYFLSPDLQKVC